MDHHFPNLSKRLITSWICG